MAKIINFRCISQIIKIECAMNLRRRRRPVETSTVVVQLFEYREAQAPCKENVTATGSRWPILPSRHHDWALQRRYMTLETLAEVGDKANVSLRAVAA